MKRILAFCSILLAWAASLTAQGSPDYQGGLRLKLNEDGNRYLRFIIWNQVWLRGIENNPGTAVNGKAEDFSLDLGLRRIRFLALAQISPRYLILTHFGINNQSFTAGGVPNGGLTGNGGAGTFGKKPGLFFHDCWNEYALILPQKDRLFSASIGAGLHYWNGVTRMASASTLNFLAVDAPIFNWYNIELSDQFAREFGVYLKGKLAKLDYRLALNRPFMTNQVPLEATGAKELNRAMDNNQGSSPWAKAGYLMYQFWEQESNTLPYTVGTYLGSKKVLNVGAGFYHSTKGTQSFALENGDTLAKQHDILNLGLDLFVDLPFGGEANWAFTGYSALAYYNYGPNYHRYTGIMNIGQRDPNFTGKVSQAGFGNARLLMGTGLISYTQAGLLLPKTWLKQPGHRLQLFSALTMMRLEHLDNEALWHYDLGCNYFLDGHHAKLSFQYSARALLMQNQPRGHKGEFILQAQIYL